MAHTFTWNTAFEGILADGDNARLLGDCIRDLKEAIRERMFLDHKWDPAAPDGTYDGTHNRVTLNQAVAIAAPAATQVRVGVLASGGVPEVFWRDPANGTQQLTKAGKLKVLSNVNEFVAGNSVTPVALTDQASVAIDCSLGNIFTLEIGGNRTLANPSNPKNGQVITVVIRQDGTGSRTITYGNLWFFPSGVNRQIDPTAGFSSVITAMYITAHGAWYANIAQKYV